MSKGATKKAFPLRNKHGTLGFDEIHRHEANYLQVVRVDYLDYDYEDEDYYRFGRREKQLANKHKVSNPPPEANLAVGFFFLAPRQRRSSAPDLGSENQERR